MKARRTAAQLSVLATIALGGGCYLSHESVGSGPPPLRDAGVPARDLGASIDASLPPPACVLGSDGVFVRVEAVAPTAAHCELTHLAQFGIFGVDAEPDVNGIRIHGDFCPAADADCRCDVVVGGIGTDVARFVPAGANYSLDLGTRDAGPAFIAVRRTALCDCPTCPCALETVLYAADTRPEMAPALPPELAFSVGAPVCTTGRCATQISLLHARVLGRESDLRVGIDTTLLSVRLRAIRNPQTTCDPCPTCGGGELMGPPTAAWAAWRETEMIALD